MPSGLLVVYINIRACISFSTILLKLILLHYLVATIEMLLTLFMPFFFPAMENVIWQVAAENIRNDMFVFMYVVVLFFCGCFISN